LRFHIGLMVFLEVSLASQEREELFTCEFLLLKLNLVNCMSSPQELGYDLSDKVSNIQAQINTNDQQIKNDLDAKIIELDAKLAAEIDSDVAAHQVTLVAATAALATNITQINETVAVMKANFDTQIMALEKKDTEMVAKIDTDVDAMETKLENKIAALKKKLKAEIDSDVAAHQVILVAATTALETKITGLDTKLENATTALDTKLLAATTALETKITDLDTKMVAEINATVAVMKAIFDAQIMALETKLNALSALFNVRHWVIYIIQCGPSMMF
jgi:ABC-type phosphate transport system auxiliary subunit